MPMRHFRGWRWEHVWAGQALSANLLLPIGALFLLPAGVSAQLGLLPAGTWLNLVALGVAWGLGGIGYGLSLALLGLSFTYSLVFSITVLVGALAPLAAAPHLPAWGVLLAGGLALCIIGAVALARAGQQRQIERCQPYSKVMSLATPIPPLRYSVALTLALIAGVLSAGQGLALAWNQAPVHAALRAGLAPLAASILVWIPLYIGAAAAALAYAGAWMWRRRNWTALWRQSPARNWALIGLMGLFGFGGVLLYGWGATAGRLPLAQAWGVYMAAFILAGNAFGLGGREWQGCSPATYRWLGTGVAALLIAILMLAVPA